METDGALDLGGSLAWKRFTFREPLNLKRVSTKYCGEILKRMLIQVKISYIKLPFDISDKTEGLVFQSCEILSDVQRYINARKVDPWHRRAI